MSLLNRAKSDEWGEIETISLQNETPDESTKKVEETSFINKSDNSAEEQSEKENDAFSKNTRPKRSTTSLNSEDVADKESLKTRYSKGSRRPSIDTLADGKSINSQSDTRSYREKLKDRINVVKERAGVSAISTQRGSKYLQKTSKNAVLSRITDILLKEEADVKEALERHKKSKELKKQEKSHTTHKSEKPPQQHEEDVSYEASLQFFTKVWKSPEETSSSESVLHSPQKENENTQAPNNGNEDCIKLLAADYLGLKETLIDPVEFKPSVLLNEDQRKKREQDLTHCPCTASVPVNQRISSDTEPRNLKDEGLFVPTYPEVKPHNFNKLHQRLVAEKNTKWFSEDGEIVRLPLPLDSTAYHPFESADDTSDLMRFEPPVIFGSEEEDLFATYINSNECYVLEFEIKNIVFTHHPLFCREHVLANRLSQLHEKYQYRLNTAITKRLASKLKALRTAHDNLKKIIETEENADMIAVHQERLNRYKMEIQETRKQRTVEGKNDNTLLMNLLSTWKDLKRMRVTQAYTSSNVKLQIFKTDDVISAAEWQNEIKRQVEETIEEIKENRKKSQKKQDDENQSESYVSIDDSINDLDLRTIQEKVLEEVSESMPTPDERSFTVTMSDQEITSDNELTNAM